MTDTLQPTDDREPKGATVAELKLPKKAKPSKALSKDLMRPALQRAHVAQPNGHRELIVTNSYMLARLPVGDDAPVGPIGAEALVRIERGEKHSIDDDGTVTITTKDSLSVAYPRPHEEFPMKEVPEFTMRDGERSLTIGLNPSLLKDLADALGAHNGVSLEVAVTADGEAALRAMRVKPLRALDERTEGLLMPVRLT